MKYIVEKPFNLTGKPYRKGDEIKGFGARFISQLITEGFVVESDGVKMPPHDKQMKKSPEAKSAE